MRGRRPATGLPGQGPRGLGDGFRLRTEKRGVGEHLRGVAGSLFVDLTCASLAAAPLVVDWAMDTKSEIESCSITATSDGVSRLADACPPPPGGSTSSSSGDGPYTGWTRTGLWRLSSWLPGITLSQVTGTKASMKRLKSSWIS